MKKSLVFLALFLCLTLAPILPGAAEDCFTLNVDALDMDSLNSDEYVTRNLSAQAQGVRVVKAVSDSSELAARVRLTLTRMDTGTLIFDKDFGYVSGYFDSDAIYLPYVDSHTVPYLVTLYVGDMVYAMPFMHLRARLTYNGGCTRGARLGDYNGALANDWMMGTMVDLDALRAGAVAEMDVCASNCYVVGRASASVEGDELTVRLGFYPDANVEVHHIALYVVTDCAAMRTGDASRMGERAYTVGEAVNVAGASTALIYLPMQLSYDPAQTLSTYAYSAADADVQRQLGLWAQNVSGAIADDSWDDNGGWVDDDGWEDNSGWDDNDGWTDAPEDDGWSDGDDWNDETDDGWEDGSGDGGAFIIAP